MISKLLILLGVLQTTNIKPKLCNSYTLQGSQVKRETNNEDTHPFLEWHDPEGALPSFSWCGPSCMKVIFPDGNIDRISLVNLFPTDETNSCIFDGTFENDSLGSLTVSGCQNDPNVYITVYSKHLRNRNVFNINKGMIEEPTNPYEIHQTSWQDQDYLEDQSTSKRTKRDVFDYEYLR